MLSGAGAGRAGTQHFKGASATKWEKRKKERRKKPAQSRAHANLSRGLQAMVPVEAWAIVDLDL
jgi:hypothetical protein